MLYLGVLRQLKLSFPNTHKLSAKENTSLQTYYEVNQVRSVTY